MEGCKHAPKAHNDTNYCSDCMPTPEQEQRHKEFFAKDVKVLQIERCSYRCMQEIMYAILNTGTRILDSWVCGKREMLINPTWTSAEILVEIPRRMQVDSNVHKTNMEFFTHIKGVKLAEPVRNFHLN